ncbi:hypothetical protein BM536_021085, partial [Streptomyces phaeoluteigriseus]
MIGSRPPAPGSPRTSAGRPHRPSPSPANAAGASHRVPLSPTGAPRHGERSPGVGSGKIVQAPVHLPVNAVGNSAHPGQWQQGTSRSTPSATASACSASRTRPAARPAFGPWACVPPGAPRVGTGGTPAAPGSATHPTPAPAHPSGH